MVRYLWSLLWRSHLLLQSVLVGRCHSAVSADVRCLSGHSVLFSVEKSNGLTCIWLFLAWHVLDSTQVTFAVHLCVVNEPRELAHLLLVVFCQLAPVGQCISKQNVEGYSVLSIYCFRTEWDKACVSFCQFFCCSQCHNPCSIEVVGSCFMFGQSRSNSAIRVPALSCRTRRCNTTVSFH